MQAYLTLARRELATYFFSITGYVILAGTTFLVGASFWGMLTTLVGEPMPVPVTESFCYSILFWVIVLLAVPVITMRLFALEKYSGTFETLMTTPVTDVQVVAAKFTAAMIFYMVMWLPLLACTLILRHYASDRSAFDLGMIGSTFLGIYLLGALLIAMGCFASALTRSQMVAAMVAFVPGFSFFLLNYVQAPAGSWKAEVLAFFRLTDHLHDFSRGVVDTRPMVLYVTLTFFFLFLTLRVVESRRWK